MKKLFLLSLLTLISMTTNVVNASENETTINTPENQQNQGMLLNPEELNGLLSTACNNSNLTESTAKKKLDAEIDTFLSIEELDILADTALEIQDLPTQEQSALCEM
jgi:hypothetical protein